MKDEIEIANVRQKQIWDRDRGFFNVKEVTYYVGKTRHTLDISMSDFNADRTEELVLAEANKVRSPLGKKK